MLPPDARYLSLDVQQYLRQQAMHLREAGATFEDISQFLGLHRDTVSRWWKAYQTQGDTALTQKTRGRKAGEHSRLTIKQCSELEQLLRDYYPNELGIDSALWSRRALQTLIEQRYGILLPLRTLSDYLHRWGFSYQKPLKRAYLQKIDAVGEWLLGEYPAIEAYAKAQKAEIHWGDQSGLCSQDTRGKGFAPVGQTPELVTTRVNQRVNYMASISAQGTVRFKLYPGRMDAIVLIEFLSRLVKSVKHKVILILDQHPVHRCNALKDWLEEHQQEIEVFYLPSYSPELNPAEYLNCDVKAGVHSKPPTRSAEELRMRVLSHLRKLQKLPGRVRKYFEHDEIAYAANG